MTAMYRPILILFLLISVSTGMKAQQDSLRIDSVVTRIRVILDEYNEKLSYVDTSDYVSNSVDADNFNLQTASSLGACNEILRLFARGADVNTFAGGVATPLHYAVASGKKEAAEILLLLGALPDKRDEYGNTPLITAVRSNDLEIAELLIRYGASVKLGDSYNSAPLHHAAALGLFYITDMLLYYDSPVEIYDTEGNSPLMIGVSFGYYETMKVLHL
jgi:ankyrin repeat protein